MSKSENEKAADCDFSPEYTGGEDPDLNFLERFKRFEKTTQIAAGGVMLIFLAVACWLEWFNYNWWLVWPFALLILRSLQRQRIALSITKPFEARIANIFFLLLIFVMIARDLVLTIIIK